MSTLKNLTGPQKSAIADIQRYVGSEWFRPDKLVYIRRSRAMCKKLYEKKVLERRYTHEIREAGIERRVELLRQTDSPYEYRLVQAVTGST